jgi:hypothetical protein
VNGRRQLGDVIAGVLQRDELETARQRDRIIKRMFPAAISHQRPLAAVSNPAACAHARSKGGEPHDAELCLPEALAIVIEQHWAAQGETK